MTRVRPRRPALAAKKRATTAAWTLAGAALATVLYALLWPPAWGYEAPWFITASFLANAARTLSLHTALIALLIAAGCAALRRWWPCCAAILAATAAATPVALTAGRGAPAPPSPDSEAAYTRFTLMTANLNHDHPGLHGILDQIERARPDFIVFQAFGPAARTALEPALLPDYPHTARAWDDGRYVQAFFSRLPFDAKPDPHPFGDRGPNWITHLIGPQFRTTVTIGGTQVVVQCVHLARSTRREWFADQRRQTLMFSRWIRSTDGPLILAGDFNSPPFSLTMREFRRAGTTDTFISHGSGLGFTWPANTLLRLLPGFRIDHILTRGGIECERTWIGPPYGSDHRPVFAELLIPISAPQEPREDNPPPDGK